MLLDLVVLSFDVYGAATSAKDHDLNIRCSDIDNRTQQIQGTLNQHIEDTTQQHTQQQTNYNAMHARDAEEAARRQSSILPIPGI